MGERIRKARREAGLSQGDLARALGYAPSQISALESGDRRLKVDDLAKLCGLLSRSADYFLRTEQEENKTHVGVRLRAELSEVPHKSLSGALEEFLDYAELEFSETGDVPDLSDLEDEVAAKRVLAIAGTQEPPVDLDRLTRALHIPVIAWSFPDALSALLADTEEDGFVIGVNRWHHLNRRRFSIAHECGHAVLRHQAGFYLDFTDVDPFGDPRKSRYKDERAANGFAAALLMPRAWLRRDVKNGLNDAATLAARYRVSEEAMSFRLRNVKLG
ncbi:MAG TPA: XRE family transcriptional regulator [Solirubrobacterales bacterium]|nr:XRE family transcriptional regulator [Solirubrobacterales bacterium]